MERIHELEAENKAMRNCYIKLTNCDYCYDYVSDEIVGYFAPHKLMREFDAAFEKPEDE